MWSDLHGVGGGGSGVPVAGGEMGGGPREMTIFTVVPVSAVDPAFGFWLATSPAATLSL